jgi:hypothetical protein
MIFANDIIRYRGYKMKTCSICKEIKNYGDFSKDSNKKDGLRLKCKPCESKQKKQYYKDNDKVIKEKRKIYRNEKRKTDPQFKFKENLSRRISLAFKLYSKNGKTKACKEYGIDFEAIYDKIGSRPDDNYQLDHKIPISVFDLDNPEDKVEFERCNNAFKTEMIIDDFKEYLSEQEDQEVKDDFWLIKEKFYKIIKENL